MYVSEEPLSAIVEQLAPFRGTGALHESMLNRLGRRLALVRLESPDSLRLVDLDDPATLGAEKLRPSQVATSRRAMTQAQAASIFQGPGDPAGLRWWSTLESSWINATLFHRATQKLRLGSVEVLTPEDPLVREACRFIGLL